jgi:hypothetical protein
MAMPKTSDTNLCVFSEEPPRVVLILSSASELLGEIMTKNANSRNSYLSPD